jgi:hypothetical protein
LSFSIFRFLLSSLHFLRFRISRVAHWRPPSLGRRVNASRVRLFQRLALDAVVLGGTAHRPKFFGGYAAPRCTSSRPWRVSRGLPLRHLCCF